MTWLPTMSIHAGLSSHEAGLLTSILSLISIPFFNDHPKPDNQFIYSQPSAHAHSGFTSWCGRHFHALFPNQ